MDSDGAPPNEGYGKERSTEREPRTRGTGRRNGEEGRRTFLVYPLHGEELVVVHAAHVPHLAVQTLVGDGRLKVGDHDVPVREGDEFD